MKKTLSGFNYDELVQLQIKANDKHVCISELLPALRKFKGVIKCAMGNEYM